MFLNIVLSIDHLYSLSGSLFCMFAASPDVSWQQWSCRLFADDSPVYLYFLFFIYCLGSFCLASLSWSVSCRPAEAGCSARCSFLSRGSKTPVKTCLTDSAALNCDPLSQTSPRGTTRLWMVQLQKSMHWKNPWSFPELLALFVFPRLFDRTTEADRGVLTVLDLDRTEGRLSLDDITSLIWYSDIHHSGCFHPAVCLHHHIRRK